MYGFLDLDNECYAFNASPLTIHSCCVIVSFVLTLASRTPAVYAKTALGECANCLRLLEQFNGETRDVRTNNAGYFLTENSQDGHRRVLGEIGELITRGHGSKWESVIYSNDRSHRHSVPPLRPFNDLVQDPISVIGGAPPVIFRTSATTSDENSPSDPCASQPRTPLSGGRLRRLRADILGGVARRSSLHWVVSIIRQPRCPCP